MVNTIKMQTIVGIRKLSAPNIRRQPTLAARPTHALIWCFSFSHCSMKNDNKHCRHHKVQSLGIEMEKAAYKSADGGAAEPIEMI